MPDVRRECPEITGRKEDSSCGQKMRLIRLVRPLSSDLTIVSVRRSIRLRCQTPSLPMRMRRSWCPTILPSSRQIVFGKQLRQMQWRKTQSIHNSVPCFRCFPRVVLCVFVGTSNLKILSRTIVCFEVKQICLFVFKIYKQIWFIWADFPEVYKALQTFDYLHVVYCFSLLRIAYFFSIRQPFRNFVRK